MNGALARVVLVGAGGVGAPFALVLAEAAGQAPAFSLEIVDDDAVEVTNLHRQILFSEAEVGAPKLEATARAVGARAPSLSVALRPGRAVPETALAIVRGAAVVIDATDNFASRFLLADACSIARVPVVHAAAVRWHATVFAVRAEGRPCYRCLFEDLPAAGAPDCATAGVVGPVCGVAGAVAADKALRILAGDASVFAAITTFDGKADVLRDVAVRARASCALCGDHRAIDALDATRYVTDADCQATSGESSPVS